MRTPPRHSRLAAEGGGAKRSTALTVALMLAVSVIFVGPSLAGHEGAMSTAFESTDGNLAASGGIDWNSFASGVDEKSALGEAWNFTVAEDDTGNKDGSIFVKNTKSHEVECPNVGSGSMGGGGNKDDLKRMYLANQNIGGDEYLFLAWTRVFPQNSTSASANLSFEFNQSEQTCAEAGFSGDRASNLTPRTDGDLLVLYDFYGGEDRVEIWISEWTETGPCESGSAPCWGQLDELTSEGHANGKVNTSDIGGVDDVYAGETIGTVAFGEAAINLSDAGIFASTGDAGQPCKGFGSAALISRSSGNSISSSLSDLAGPVDFELSNCGSLTIEKVTDPTGLDDEFDFDIEGPDDFADTFSLADDESETYNDVFAGGYTITEADAGPEFELTDITCTGTDEGNIDADVITGTVTVDLAADENVTCTFTNTRQPGSILVLKHDEDGNLLAGAGFTIDPANLDGDTDMTEYADGVFCIDNVAFGSYTVTETTVPDGYNGGLPDDGVAVDSVSTCADRLDDDGLPNGDTDSVFENTPEPGTVNIVKEDDAGNPLPGIGFTLFVDDNKDDVHQETETTVGKAEQSTDGEGKVTFTDVPLGFYCAVETTTSPDHDAAAPQCFEVGLGDEPNAGQTITLKTFVNPRQHRIIVLVCHEGNDTLHASDVELDGVTLQSLDSTGMTPDEQKELCDLGGASFGGISGHDTGDLEVTPGSH